MQLCTYTPTLIGYVPAWFAYCTSGYVAMASHYIKYWVSRNPGRAVVESDVRDWEKLPKHGRWFDTRAAADAYHARLGSGDEVLYTVTDRGTVKKLYARDCESYNGKIFETIQDAAVYGRLACARLAVAQAKSALKRADEEFARERYKFEEALTVYKRAEAAHLRAKGDLDHANDMLMQIDVAKVKTHPGASD